MSEISQLLNNLFIVRACKDDQSGFIETLLRTAVECGMPVENVAGFLMKLAINTTQLKGLGQQDGYTDNRQDDRFYTATALCRDS